MNQSLSDILKITNEEFEKKSSYELPKAEELTAPLINNSATAKKIEERREFIRNIEHARSESFGLRQSTSSSGAPVTSTSNSSAKDTRNYSQPGSYGYAHPQSPYSYSYAKPAETLEKKAVDYTTKVVKDACQESLNEAAKEEKIKRSNWNMFESEEDEKIERLKSRTAKQATKKKKPKTVKSAKQEVFLIRMGVYALKAVMETLYIYKNNKK